MAFILSCAIDIPNGEDNEHPPFPSGDTLDILTWNLELFPKNNSSSVDYLETAINTLKPDIIAMQEVSSETALQQLASRLDDYSYAKADGGSDWGLAYLYNSELVTLFTAPYEIYTSSSRPFPRPPFIMEARWNGHKIVIINNHLKAGGDGHIDLNDNYDEETRRKEAMELLDEHIVNNFNNERVVVLGDMNDELTDVEQNNVFIEMINDPQSYQFTDMPIAQGSNLNWSYPSWPSHIDHILITNELFTAHFETNTVLYDTYLDGRWTEYEEYISDHRPVAISLVISGE